MRLDTNNFEHMKVLYDTVKRFNKITAKTDQNFDVRISLNKNAQNELDSLWAINESFDISNSKEQFTLSEFDYITISDKLID